MKKTKKALSLFLSFLMAGSVVSVGMLGVSASDNIGNKQNGNTKITADQEEEYITSRSWNASSFKNDDLVFGDESLYNIYTRRQTAGAYCSGMVGYASYGNTVALKAHHTYRYDVQVYIDSVAEGDEDEPILFADMHNQSVSKPAPENTYFSNGLLKSDYDKIDGYEYDPVYGHKYKTVSLELSARESGVGEPRIYYNHITSETKYETKESYGVGYVRVYKCFVYDLGNKENPSNTLIQTLDCGNDNIMSEESFGVNPKHPDAEPISSIVLPAGIHVSKANVGNCDNTMLVGNAGINLSKGKYKFNYTFVNIEEDAEGTLFTLDIAKDGVSQYKKEIAKSDIPDNGLVSVPYEVTEAGNYTSSLLIGNKTGFIITSISIEINVDFQEIADVDSKIAAIGTVEYTDECKAKITDASDAYNALVEKYGDVDTIDSYLENETVLLDALDAYEQLESKQALINNTVQLINAIGEVTKDSLENIVAAEDSVENLKLTYGNDVVNSIPNYQILLDSRAKYDSLFIIKLGDVDQNGDITSYDALLALQAAVGKKELTESQKSAADIDKNGTVTTSDALKILQAAVGKIQL